MLFFVKDPIQKRNRPIQGFQVGWPWSGDQGTELRALQLRLQLRCSLHCASPHLANQAYKFDWVHAQTTCTPHFPQQYAQRAKEHCCPQQHQTNCAISYTAPWRLRFFLTPQEPYFLQRSRRFSRALSPAPRSSSLRRRRSWYSSTSRTAYLRASDFNHLSYYDPYPFQRTK